MAAKLFLPILLLFSLSLTACSPLTTRATVTPLPPTANRLLPTDTHSATPTGLPTPASTATEAGPRIAPADEILETNSVHSIPFSSVVGTSDLVAQMTLDERYLYVVGEGQAGSLYRIPFGGGSPERIAGTKYPNGRLNLFRPILTGDWIVFADTPTTLQGVSDRWMVRAVNLKDLSERVVLESIPSQPSNIMNTYFTGEAGRLYWTRSTYAAEDKIDRTTVSMMNLDSGKTALLNQTSYAGWTWSLVQVSNGQLILEQSQENYHSDIYLFDPANGQPQALSDDGMSQWPLIDFPWVAWEEGPGFQQLKLHLYNLQTRQSRTVSLPGTDNTLPLLNGAFVCWSGAADSTASSHYAFFIYDLTMNVVYQYLSPEPNVIFSNIVLRGNTIAWVRDDIAGTGKNTLEWTTIK